MNGFLRLLPSCFCLLPHQVLQALRHSRLKIRGIEAVQVHRPHFDLLRCGTLYHLAVFLLLGSRQRLDPHLQLHGLHDEFPFAEPQNQIVAFLHALGMHPRLIVQLGQLVSPFLLVFPAFVFLQNRDLVLQRGSAPLVNLIFQHVPSQVVRRDSDEFLIKLHRFVEILQHHRDLHHLVDDHAADGRAVIRDIQNLIAVLVPLRLFIGLRHLQKQAHIPHLTPVYGIRDLRRGLVISLFQQLPQLLRLYLKLILIQ